MIQNPIYKPKGRALEYSPDALALNIYRGCTHGCIYCFAPSVLRVSRKEFACAKQRKDIVESVKRQLEREQITGKLIHLCFTCDPYPADIDTAPTREIIKIIKESGNYVQILTKGIGAARDFDLLDENDWFGVTATNNRRGQHEYEPNAADSIYRNDALCAAKRCGINTWVSCEPVYEPETVYKIIMECSYIDMFRIGKLNLHRGDPPELKELHDSINWAEFGKKCIDLCEQYGRHYYIKDDLVMEMKKGGTHARSPC